MFPWRRPQSAELPDAGGRDPCATLLPIPPLLSANFLKIPAAFLRIARITKSHLRSTRQTRQSLCPGTTAASCAPYASSRGRPSSPGHRRSTPLSPLCARTIPSFHALRRASAHYFAHLPFDHYTLACRLAPKHAKFGTGYDRT